MKYLIYFEFCKKKMRVEIEAETSSDAEKQLRQKIIIHKIMVPKISDEEDLLKKYAEKFGFNPNDASFANDFKGEKDFKNIFGDIFGPKGTK